VLAREPRARGGFGVLLEIKTTRLRRVVSQVRRGITSRDLTRRRTRARVAVPCPCRAGPAYVDVQKNSRAVSKRRSVDASESVRPD
jgi:hypothetical protein